MWLTILWSAFLVHGTFCLDVQESVQKSVQDPVKDDTDEAVRDRRDVIEEEKYYNIRTDNRNNNANQPPPWLPGHALPEDPTTKITITHEPLPLYQTTEIITEKPTGRGARASNENWIKLPFPDQDELNRNVLQPPKQSGDLINSRMPRVNFVTQNKPLEASETRSDKESIQRSTRTDDLRTEFVRPEGRDQYKPVYPRQAVYYPEERRYDDRYYAPDDLYRRDPYYDLYDRRYSQRLDRYDEYDNYVPRKPKRIIYYAHLPDVVRTPPSVDLRYRYSVDPYRREDDYSARAGRYDYRFRNRYPYPLRKEERRFGYRDLAGAGTVSKDKKVEEKVTPTPVLPQKEDKKPGDSNRDMNRHNINSHQYHESDSLYNMATHKTFNNAVRADDNYLRFDGPLFQGTVEDPYQRKY